MHKSSAASNKQSPVGQKFVMIRAIPDSRENAAQASAAFGIGRRLLVTAMRASRPRLDP
jgi:hypothetical protein